MRNIMMHVPLIKNLCKREMGEGGSSKRGEGGKGIEEVEDQSACMYLVTYICTCVGEGGRERTGDEGVDNRICVYIHCLLFITHLYIAVFFRTMKC